MDSIGWTDREPSAVLGKTAIDLLFAWTEIQFSSGGSVICEMNFHARLDPPRFASLGSRFPCRFVQVHCSAPNSLLIERYRERAMSREMHPGHFDGSIEVQDSFANGLVRGDWAPLNMPGRLFRIDPLKLDYTRFMTDVASAISGNGQDTDRATDSFDPI